MSPRESRIVRAAERLVANNLEIRRVSREIIEGVQRCTKRDAATNEDPCAWRKVERPASQECSGFEELPWYAWPKKTAAEIGAKLGYCPECIAQVDRFRARKVLKAKRGAHATELQRAVESARPVEIKP